MDLYSALLAKELVKADSKSLIVNFGEWTPRFYQVQYSQPLPTLSYETQVGYYYRIGRICFINFNLQANITGTSNAYLSVSGFPFIGIEGGGKSIFSFFSGIRGNNNVFHVSVARISDYATYLLFPDQSGTGNDAYAKFQTGNITLQYSGSYIINSVHDEYEKN